MPRARWIALVAALLLPTAALARDKDRDRDKDEPRKSWLPDEMPLPLPVHDARDLQFKAVVEREYLVFNLLASGKLAWDAGRYAEAADHWETLLQMPDLSKDIDRVVRPLAIEARQRSGAAPRVAAAPPSPSPPPVVEETPKPKARERTSFDVHGTIEGGGPAGPWGAVVWMKRADGKTPAPTPKGEYVMSQIRKEFVPHVLTVPVGATVSFRNDDEIFHDVFTPNGFDLGLYKGGLSRDQTFDKPGATPLYCNIHAHMNAWVVALDTPHYAVVDNSAGRFTIRGVPVGDYVVEVWHEGASKTSRFSVTVAAGMEPLALTVGNDRQPAPYPLDKYGKPRQPHREY